MADEYLTAEEIAIKWGISTRRVQKLCAEGKIRDAKRFGKSWAIPICAVKPKDGRKKSSLERETEK